MDIHSCILSFQCVLKVYLATCASLNVTAITMVTATPLLGLAIVTWGGQGPCVRSLAPLIGLDRTANIPAPARMVLVVIVCQAAAHAQWDFMDKTVNLVNLPFNNM